jgi:hypothetical protein
MRPASPLLAAALFALTTLALAGCETSRTNKLHADFEHTADIATYPHPDPKFASVATGIPPVPGSPTGAGHDGLQPLDDDQARVDPGAEKGIPTYPREQPRARFIRQ